MPRFSLAFPGSSEDGLNVKIVARGEGFPDAPHFIHDGILCHVSFSQ